MKVVSVRADRQNLSMTGGALDGLVALTINFLSLNPTGFSPPITGVPAYRLRSSDANGIPIGTLTLPQPGISLTGDPVYPLSVPIDIVVLGGNTFVEEFSIAAADSDVTVSLLRVSGSHFSNPTPIPVDLIFATAGGVTFPLFYAFFAGLFGGILGANTDGTNIMLAGDFDSSGDISTMRVASFSTAGGARNATYNVEAAAPAFIITWITDKDNANFWLFNSNMPTIYRGPFAGPYPVAFDLSGDLGTSSAIIADAAVDSVDGMLYVIYRLSGGSVVCKIDPTVGIVHTYTLSASRPGFTGDPSNLPYAIAAHNGFIYVACFSNVWTSFNGIWKINTQTHTGTGNPAFNMSGVDLNAMAAALDAPGADLRAIAVEFSGAFELVSSLRISGNHSGNPANLRQGDVKVTDGLEMTHVPGDNQSQRSN